MEKLTIAVYVSREAAVLAGLTSFGASTYAPTAAEVASLTTDERREMLTYADGQSLHLTAPAVTWEAIVSAVRAALAKRAAEEAAKEARREREIQTALAEPVDAWITTTHEGCYCTDDRGEYALSGKPHSRPVGARVPWQVRDSDDDPRIVARLAHVRDVVLPRLVAEYAVQKAEADRVVAAQRAAAQAEREAYRAAVLALAARWSDVAPAAREGYDVTGAVLDHVADDLADAVTDAEHAIDTAAYRDPAERRAPSPENLALRARVAEAVDRANRDLPAAVGQWTTSRVVRIDTCPHDGERHQVTAVLATLETPAGDIREVTYSLESLACDHR